MALVPSVCADITITSNIAKMKTMSSIYSAPAARSMVTRRFSVFATLRQWHATYMGWRAENAAIAHLCAMSDQQLNDIGLMRSQVAQAVQGATLDRAPSYHC
jgi:uncharacterized protein YjiS (DUF1127 family)